MTLPALRAKGTRLQCVVARRGLGTLTAEQVNICSVSGNEFTAGHIMIIKHHKSVAVSLILLKPGS